MKKYIVFLLIITFTILIVYKGIDQVKAADTIKIGTCNKIANSKEGAHYRKTTKGDIVYCMQNGVSGPGKGATLTYKGTTYTKGGIVYILNDTKYSGNGNSTKSVQIRQQALWMYLHYINSNSYKKSVSSKSAYYTQSKELYDAAKKAGKDFSINPTITKVTNPGELTKGNDNYYTSKAINVVLKDVTGNKYKISFSGAPSGTAAYTKSTGGKKISGYTNASTFVVKVPVSSVKKTSLFTIKIIGNKSSYKTVKRYYIKNKQDMALPTSKSKEPSKSVVAKVTYQTCHKIGNTYYGPNGAKVTESEYIKSSCVKPCAKDIITGKYIDKNKISYSGETAEYLKSCFSCEKHGNEYIDANGNKVDLKNYARTCANPCSKTKDKYGYYYDKDYNYYTSINNAFLKSCAACGVFDGKYYDRNGNQVTKTEQNRLCIGTCISKNGKFYDNTGKEVSEKQMNKACFNCSKKADGTYIDSYGNKVSEAAYYKSCKPYCTKSDGNYYDANHRPVSEDAYKKSCLKSCGVKDGIYYDKNYNPVSYEEYKHSCLPQTPISDPIKSADTELIRYEKNYHYTIKHEIPYRTKIDQFKSYIFTDILEEPLQITSAANVKIIQLDKANNKRTDWTNRFNINVDGQKVTATLKDNYLKETSFYGTLSATGKEYNKEYSFVLTVSLKDSADTRIDMSKYKVEDEYIIPDTASISTITADGTTIAQNTNKVEVKYILDPKPIKSVSDFNQTASYENGTSYTYTITQQVLNYKGNQRYKDFVLKDKFEAPIEMRSNSNLTVKDEAGNDVTNWFKTSINGQNLIVKLKDEYNTDSFYGHIYDFTTTVNIKHNYNLKKYLKGNNYIIPNYAIIIFDNNNSNKTNIVNVTVNKKVVPKVIIPNTASPFQITLIAAGIAIIISGIYAIIEKYNFASILFENKGNELKPKNKENKNELLKLIDKKSKTSIRKKITKNKSKK